MKKIFTILLLVYMPLLFAQEEKVYFDDALALHLRKYNNKSDLAIKNRMLNAVDTIFNSLVKNHLKNTYVSDLKLRKIAGGYLQTDKINRPFLLISKNSALIQHKEEIKTINSIANEYKGIVDIIVIYWDKKPIAKKRTRNYNKNVIVVYVDERYNSFNKALSVYKHSFGVPTCFYINQNKQIIDIDRKFFLSTKNASTRERFVERTHKGISELLASHSENTKVAEIVAKELR